MKPIVTATPRLPVCNPPTRHDSACTYLKHNNKPQIPPYLPLNPRQLKRRIKRPATLRRLQDEFRMLCIQCQKGTSAVRFLSGGDVRMETECCDPRHWGGGRI